MPRTLSLAMCLAVLIGWVAPQETSAQCSSWAGGGCGFEAMLIGPHDFHLVTGVNNNGQIGLNSGPSGGTPKGGLLNAGEEPIWFSTFLGNINDWSFSVAINNEGQVAGFRPGFWSWVNDGTQLVNVPGLPRTPPFFTGNPNPAWATGINDLGQVIGWSALGGFVWDPISGTRPVTSDPINTNLRPLDINNAGVVVGTSETPDGDQGFIQYDDNSAPILLGANSSAFAVNSFGLVVGTILNPLTGIFDDFLYNAGTSQFLGFDASSIDDAGRLAGSDDGRAVLWETGTQFFLDALVGAGWLFTSATMSDNGQWILATGTNTVTGYTGDVLLMVTPEPATIFLLSSGLAGLAAAARRRKRRTTMRP